ncbi:MAG TPA: glycosyltransferase [Solirubrobacterales bacterium]|nr:glycosyltransferase [Solirubrobacterales bacterium]
MSAPGDFSYVVPIRWRDGAQRRELADYLERIAPHCAEVIVVDGSEPDVFAANAGAWGRHAKHVPPAAGESWLMGKVSGVRTGVRLAAHERVVIADDDVRYEPEALRRAAALLDEHDVVRPQNYFCRLPWHARWDTARTLLNRSVGRDYPGTLAVRRSRMLAMGLYDGDVLFENLELIRTVRAHGGSVVSPLDLYVARVPPSASHFWGQRTRQAYDDFALPLRMALWLAVLPLLALGFLRRRPALALAPAALAVVAAERGRRRAGGSAFFPATSALLAPVWILERGVCAWLAVLQRLRFGGVRYGDSVIPVAAHSERQLRRRFAEGRQGVDAGRGEGWSPGSNGEPPPTSTGSKTPASTGTSSRPSPA